MAFNGNINHLLDALRQGELNSTPVEEIQRRVDSHMQGVFKEVLQRHQERLIAALGVEEKHLQPPIGTESKEAPEPIQAPRRVIEP